MMELFNKLKPNKINPRKINDEELMRLKKKIVEFPEMLEKRPIVYDENFVVLGGNQRLRVIKELVKDGFELKETYFSSAADWSDEQKKNFVINDNISEGAWDYEMLENQWGDCPLDEWGIEMVNMDIEKVEDVEVDESRMNVLTVEAPESPKLKERMAFYFDSIEKYEIVKNFFAKGLSNLDEKKLLDLIEKSE